MVILRRITEPEENILTELFNLYVNTFPPQERRETTQLKKLIAGEPRMHFSIIQESDEPCGLVVYWDFDSFRYLEHLAVFPEKRNRKIGQQVLEYMATHMKGPRILEVEPSVDEITTRRINYYRRNGYEVLDRDYIQPPYSGKSTESLPLWIMGNPEAVEPYELKKYIQTIKEEVYGAKDRIR